MPAFHAFLAIFTAGLILSSPQSGHSKSEIEGRLDRIKSLIDSAARGKNQNVTYIVSGDSTRDSYTAGQEYIYSTMLAQVNVAYVHNARSGLRAYQWVRNTVPSASLEKAISHTQGEGENTIMEFSLGINDRNAFSRADTKENLLTSLKEYLKAKPKAHVFLVVPVTHQTHHQKDWLKMYQEISTELKLPLLNKERVMYAAFYDSQDRFYYDATHPNYFGGLRLTKYILDSVSGSLAKNKYTWHKDFFIGAKGKTAGANLAAAKKIIPKSWYWPHNKSATLKGGSVQSNPVMSRVEPFAVTGNSLIKISGVKAAWVSMMDEKSELVYTFAVSQWKNHDIDYVCIPKGVAEVRISIKDSANAGPAVVEYLLSGALTELTEKEVYYSISTVISTK